MITASKAIMALAAKGKYQMDDSCRAIQNQTVTVNVQQHPTVTATTTPASVITNTQPRTPVHEPSSFQEPVAEEVAEDVETEAVEVVEENPELTADQDETVIE